MEKHAVRDAMDKFRKTLNDFIYANAPAVVEYLALKEEISDITSSVPENTNLFVQAVLYDGAEFQNLYSIPSSFVWNEDQLAEWVAFFGIGDTLKTVYRINGIKPPSGFSPKKCDWDHCEVKEYQSLLKVVAIVRSRLEVIRNNLSAAISITEEQKAFAKALEFDHYYDYSDDGSVWRSGRDAHTKAQKAIQEALAKNPEMIEVVKKVSQYLKFSEKFFTG